MVSHCRLLEELLDEMGYGVEPEVNDDEEPDEHGNEAEDQALAARRRD